MGKETTMNIPLKDAHICTNCDSVVTVTNHRCDHCNSDSVMPMVRIQLKETVTVTGIKEVKWREDALQEPRRYEIISEGLP